MRVGEEAAEVEGVREEAAEVEGVREEAAEVEGVREEAAEVEGVREDDLCFLVLVDGLGDDSRDIKDFAPIRNP